MSGRAYRVLGRQVVRKEGYLQWDATGHLLN